MILTQCQRAKDADATILQQYVKHHLEISEGLLARGMELQNLSFTIYRIKEEISKAIMQRLQVITHIQQNIKACRRAHSFNGFFFFFF